MATAIKTKISLGDTVSVVEHPELVGVVEVLSDREALVSRNGDISVFPIYFLQKANPSLVVDLTTKKPKTIVIHKTIPCCKKCHCFFNKGGQITNEYVKKCVRNGWKVTFDSNCFGCKESPC
jgi:hypothetical protein